MTTTSERATTRPVGRVGGMLRGSGAVAISIVVMNLATYAFQMVAARTLGPAQYGGVASLMAMLLVVGVAMLGLQAVGARRVAADPGQVAHIEAVVLRTTYRVALALGLLLLALSPLVASLLRLDSIYPALLLALSAVPLTVVGGQLGILQGERRWVPLGLCYLALGLGRLLAGSIAVALRASEGAAMAGVTLGLFAPAAIGWWVLRGGREDDVADEGGHPLRDVVRETVTSSQALLAFFVLSNLDIVVARNVLDGHDAGLYAGGLILTKAVLFLPQFVVVLAFPAMSTAAARRRALLVSLGAVVACGVVSIGGALLLSDIAMIFVGGDDYTDVRTRLWLFALLGTVLAGLQMLVYSVLARQSNRAAALVWVFVAALVVLTLLASSLVTLVVTVIVVDAVLLAVLLGLSLYRMRGDAPALAR